MEPTELERIVAEEGLDAPILRGEAPLHEDAVVLDPVEGAWEVYLVDERDAVVESTRRRFENPSEALEHVLRKLRQVKRAREAVARMRARGPAPSAEPGER